MLARGMEWVLLNFRLRWGIFLQREGKQTFVLSPPIGYPQNIGLIPHIRKCLRCASPQITNPQIVMINLQVQNTQISKK